MSSGASLAFMVIGLLAMAVAFGTLWRRSRPDAAAQPGSHSQLEREAEQILARAEVEVS